MILLPLLLDPATLSDTALKVHCQAAWLRLLRACRGRVLMLHGEGRGRGRCSCLCMCSYAMTWACVCVYVNVCVRAFIFLSGVTQEVIISEVNVDA